jgi:hypothetical protein
MGLSIHRRRRFQGDKGPQGAQEQVQRASLHPAVLSMSSAGVERRSATNSVH